MVYLYSGTPGSGKSLHAAGDIYEAARYGSKKLIITNFSINTQKIKKQKNEILVIPNWEITVQRIQEECRNFFATYYKGKIREGKVLMKPGSCLIAGIIGLPGDGTGVLLYPSIANMAVIFT